MTEASSTISRNSHTLPSERTPRPDLPESALETKSDFMSFCAEQEARGQLELARATRALIERSDPETYAHVQSEPDALFLEPLLFSAAHAATLASELPALLFGNLQPEARPDAIEVSSDCHGRIYLPSIGYLHTDTADCELVVHWDRTIDRYALTQLDLKPIDFHFEPLLTIPGTQIEVLRYPHRLLCGLFRDEDGAPQDMSLGDAPARHLRSVSRAFAMLSAFEPLLYREIQRTTRRLVIFENPNVASFASIAAHGMAFLGARSRFGEVFFLDDIAHQCGHVVFNAMSAPPTRLLSGAPDTRLGALDGSKDPRTIYEAFHGLYTEYHMCNALESCEEHAELDAVDRHELRGRFARIARSYAQDARSLDWDGYTPEGRYCFEVLRQSAVRLEAMRPDLWEFDLEGMPYVFDYAHFAKRNPLS